MSRVRIGTPQVAWKLLFPKPVNTIPSWRSMTGFAEASLNQTQTDRTAGWRDAQLQVLDFMQKHPRQWWAIDRLSRSINLPQGYVTMLLVELWIEGRVTRQWAGDQPIFQLYKEN